MFDTALLESGPSRRVRGKGAGLPLAITAHLVLIGAFVGASAWTVGDPQEPETRIAVFPTFTSFSAAPPPSGGTPPAVPQPRRSNALVQPTSLPPDLPDLPDLPEQNSLPPGCRPRVSGARQARTQYPRSE